MSQIPPSSHSTASATDATHDAFSTLTDLTTLCDRVNDGMTVALAPDYSGCSMTLIHELIKRERRDLHLIGVPQMGLQADLLIGAGCVSSVEAAAVTLSECGQAPRFVDAVQSGLITVRDSTCPVIHAGLQAAEKGIPFMPLRGILGSDLIRHRDDWVVVNNPMAGASDDPILLVPAIKPDVSVLHAPLADRDGNVWVGIRRELMLMAHASQQTLVTVEQIQENSLLADDHMAPGTIPAMYVSAIAKVPHGGHPVGLFGCYDADAAELKRYASMAKEPDGFKRYLAELPECDIASQSPVRV